MDGLPASLRRAKERSDAFFDWEVQGQGWTTWPYPVALEPPFSVPATPTRGQEEPRDDGRVPGLIEAPFRLLNWALKSLLEKKGTEKEPKLAKARVDPVELVTLCLLPSPEQGADPRAWQQLLLALPSLHTPICFELLGESAQVSLALQVPEQFVGEVKAQVSAHVPSLSLVEAPDRLAEQWSALDEQGLFIVDFGLAQEFTRPLQSSTNWKVDPLTSLFGALSALEPNELAVVQVQFQLCRSSWAETALEALVTSDGRPFFADAPEMLPLAKDKFSSPLFAVVLRLGGKTNSQRRASQIAQSIAQGLLPLARVPSNHLVALDPGPLDDELLEEDLLLRQSRRSGMLLSASELASLAHPPSEALHLPKLARTVRASRRAPDFCSEEGVLLGVNEHGGETQEVRLAPALRAKHVHLIGASGTGKSTLMLQMLLQDLDAGRGLCLIDPHGDLTDEVLSRMPEERHKDLILVDPADADYSVAFNVLHASSELERQLLSSDLVATFRRLSTSWGDRMNSVLANAVLSFLESSEGGTLLDLRRFLVSRKFRRRFLGTVKDPELLQYWYREYPQLPRGAASPVLTRLDGFLRHKLIRHMVAQKKSSFDLRESMDSSKVLLGRLSQGAIGEENAALLGALFVSRLQQAAQSRQELAESERTFFSLYLDEFHSYLTPSMAGILSGARKYRMGLVLAHQDLSQLGSRETGILGAAISNPATRICFRLGDKDARSLADGLAHFQSSNLQSLSVGQALCRVERADQDFNLKTLPLSRLDEAEASLAMTAAVESSRSRYGRKREEIEADTARAYEPSEETQSGKASREAAQELEPKSKPSQGAPKKETSSKDKKPLVEVAKPGRGGQQHKYWQRLVKELGLKAGWKARVEAPLPKTHGFVDVLLTSEARAIGVEVSISTGGEHELANVRKCLEAELDVVACLVVQASTRRELEVLVSQELSKEQSKRVLIGRAESMMSSLEQLLSAGAGSKESHVRGYVVKVEEAERSPDKSFDVLADLIKRLWRRPGEGKGEE